MTLVETIAQPATTFVSTRTQAIIITDYAQYGFVVASEAAATSKSSTSKDIPSSTGTDADASPSANSQGAPAPATAPSKLPLILSVVLGVISLVFIASLIGWYMLWRRRKHRKNATAPASTTPGAETSELAGTTNIAQKTGSTTRITASPVEIDSLEKTTNSPSAHVLKSQTSTQCRSQDSATLGISIVADVPRSFFKHDAYGTLQRRQYPQRDQIKALSSTTRLVPRAEVSYLSFVDRGQQPGDYP
ncbi:hypothetical protein LTR70_001814 [Exophiala xenobiotica]|uniref:Uncharacterized protein n=1 Tax=Lithohypha guttulata TaxID=1690604 RepID=A0ABR0KNX8_9EURO|nr:hypothetical protein LTR24_000992 [Lithohypha guttulata]KAK5327072.1 hypothetical protein LTR70_001814 [Exophiala xenobiotica]